VSNILGISEAASLGLHAMVLLAANTDNVVTTKVIADCLGVSEAHLSKVLQRLARFGLVTSLRGPGGGFALSSKGREVRLLDVYEAIEGPLEPADCLFRVPICRGNKCILGGVLKTLNRQVKRYLAQTKLSELTGLYENGRFGAK